METVTEKEKFLELLRKWEKDTIFLSSTQDAIKHPIFCEIVSMGESAIPWLLESLQWEGSWQAMMALGFITKINPVPNKSRGKFRLVKEHWLGWGMANGYIAGKKIFYGDMASLDNKVYKWLKEKRKKYKIVIKRNIFCHDTHLDGDLASIIYYESVSKRQTG